MKIGIDIDDVLIDFCAPFVQFHNKHYGMDWKEMRSYRLEDLTGDTWDQMQLKMDAFVEEADIFNQSINPAIRKSFKNISREHELFIITARPDHYKEGTKRWIETNLAGLYKELYFMYGKDQQNEKIEKWQFCKNLGIEVMIEDLEEHATPCAKNGIRVLLFDHEWNADVDGKNITRVHNWQEIEKILIREKVAP